MFDLTNWLYALPILIVLGRIEIVVGNILATGTTTY